MASSKPPYFKFFAFLPAQSALCGRVVNKKVDSSLHKYSLNNTTLAQRYRVVTMGITVWNLFRRDSQWLGVGGDVGGLWIRVYKVDKVDQVGRVGWALSARGSLTYWNCRSKKITFRF